MDPVEYVTVKDDQRLVSHPRLPYQRYLCGLADPRIVLSGAFRTGKTRGLLLAGLPHFHKPGNFVGIFRHTYTSLQHTTLRELLFPVVYPGGIVPPILTPGTYTWNKSAHIIEVHGGATIYYGGCDDHERIRSFTFGCVLVDEVSEIDREEFNMLDGRLSSPAAFRRQLIAVTNPATPGHWMYKRFYLNPLKGDRALTVPAFMADGSAVNFFLPADYLDRLRLYEGAERDRYVLGKWSAFEGLVYARFREDVHVVHRPGPWSSVVCGVDSGFTHPAALVVVGVDGDGRAHILAVVKETGLEKSEVAAWAVRLKKQFGISRFFVDPSAPDLIKTMKRANLLAVGADNSKGGRIRSIKDRLLVAGDGQPRITFEPPCPGIVEELNSWAWKKAVGGVLSETPQDINNDALDATGYAVLGFETRRSPQVRRLG